MSDLEFWLEGIIDVFRFLVFSILYLIGIIMFPLWIIPYLIWKHRHNAS